MDEFSEDDKQLFNEYLEALKDPSKNSEILKSLESKIQLIKNSTDKI